jgi:hypothetical protein
MLSAVRRWFGRWQELVLWLPSIFCVLLVAHYLLPALDPRSGVDGFGSVWGQLVVSFGVMLAGFFTWVLRTLYSYELTDKDERELIDHAAGIDRAANSERIGAGPMSWPAFWILALDKVQWCFVFWLLLQRFAP